MSDVSSNRGDGMPLDTPLWRSVVRLYDAPEVASSCLQLQDGLGADINLVLVCCLVGKQGAYLPRKEIETLMQLATPWRIEAIEPLRRIRRRLATAVGPITRDRSDMVREAVQDAELLAEKIELAMLYGALERLPAKNAREAVRSGVVRSNLLNYLSAAVAAAPWSPDERTRQAIETIVTATNAGDDLDWF